MIRKKHKNSKETTAASRPCGGRRHRILSAAAALLITAAAASLALQPAAAITTNAAAGSNSSGNNQSAGRTHKETSSTGYINIDKRSCKVPETDGGLRSAESLPSYYRSDQQSWADGISVKNQGESSLCWACSMISAAEYSYAKEISETSAAGLSSTAGQTSATGSASETSTSGLSAASTSSEISTSGQTSATGSASETSTSGLSAASTSSEISTSGQTSATGSASETSAAGLSAASTSSEISTAGQTSATANASVSTSASSQSSTAALSAGHLGYFFYNRVSDPLGLTVGDANIIKKGETAWPFMGGNQIYGMQHLAGWSGLAAEADAPFSRITKGISVTGRGELKWNDSYKPYADRLAYNDAATLQECILYAEGTDTETIKSLIYEYGAVSAALCFDTEYYLTWDKEKNDYGSAFYNFDGSTDLDHAVTIVGWDDSYPKENFSHSAQASGKPMTDWDGREYSAKRALEATTPDEDGAWIVQNSWGSEIHDNGFFYVSYESSDIAGTWLDGRLWRSDITVYDLQPADTYKYNFHYDGTALCFDSYDAGYKDCRTGKGAKAANVYTNNSGEPVTVEAVGFTSYNEGTTAYTIDIYRGLRDPDDPESGTLVSTTEASTETGGVKTIALDTPVTIGSGQTYSVVVSFSRKTYFGVEKSYEYYGIVYRAQTSAGQSFVRAADSDAWKDMNDYKLCYRIKAFANAATADEEETAYKDEYDAAVSTALESSSKITSVKAKSGRKATVKWKKASGVSGYEIAYSTSKTFSKGVKSLTVKGSAKTKKTLKSLKKGKTYYVKVRPYVNTANRQSGETETLYGSWSAAKKFKAKS